MEPESITPPAIELPFPPSRDEGSATSSDLESSTTAVKLHPIERKTDERAPEVELRDQVPLTNDLLSPETASLAAEETAEEALLHRRLLHEDLLLHRQLVLHKDLPLHRRLLLLHRHLVRHLVVQRKIPIRF